MADWCEEPDNPNYPTAPFARELERVKKMHANKQLPADKLSELRALATRWEESSKTLASIALKFPWTADRAKELHDHAEALFTIVGRGER